HIREYLRIQREKEAAQVKTREQALFEQKEGDQLEQAIERAVQQEEHAAKAKLANDEEPKPQPEVIPPAIVITQQESGKTKISPRLPALTKDRPLQEGKRLPSEEKIARMKAISTMCQTIPVDAKPSTPSRKRKSTDEEDNASMAEEERAQIRD